MNNNVIECSKIAVDCVSNDPVDIRSGGPYYLGFDFFVKTQELEEMKKFIAATLESFEVPLVNMYFDGTYNLNENKVWDKKRIVESIQKEADYLIKQASRNYCRAYRK